MNCFKGKKRKPWLVFLFIFFGFLLLEIFLYARLLSIRGSFARTLVDSDTRPVKVITPDKSSGHVYIRVLGRVKAGQEVDVRTDISGTVRRINCLLGAEVRKDQVIVELDDYRTEALFEEAKYKLRSARSTLEESRRIYRRDEILFEKGIVSEDQLSASRNRVEVGSADVKAIEAFFDRAKWDYDSLMLRSPIHGRIVEIVPDVGQDVAAGNLVARVMNLESMKVVVGVDAGVARTVEPGDAVSVYESSDDEEDAVSARIKAVSPGADASVGIYDVEIAIDPSYALWLPGEMVFVKIPVKILRGVTSVPKKAVLSDIVGSYILVEKNGEAFRVPVNVVWTSESFGYVPFDSIPPDSRIIVDGNSGLVPGSRVSVID